MPETTERQIIELIATDRIDIPISSMSGKLKRAKPKLAKSVDLSPYKGQSFAGERCYARIESEELMKARGMRDGIEEFANRHPQYGKILNGIIEEKRVERETYLYFGVQPGCRLTADDYMGVMQSLGFTEGTARSLYPELMDISYKLSRKRGEERSILIG